MSENSPRPKDPVRIVYHAENRTFARLFNERSLDEVKDVVRRKLALGRDTDVSLKQIGPNMLLDLEDDDDFQAFSILLKSSDSLDIQVTVGRSQGPVVPPPTEPSREKLSVSEPLVTSQESHPKEPGTPAKPMAATATKLSTVTKKKSDPARKRKVSFSGEAAETLGKPAEEHGPSESGATTITAAPSAAMMPEMPAAAKLTEEPPKKKRKTTKPREPTDTPKTKVKKTKTTKLARDSETGTSAPKDVEASEQPVKKPRKKKEKQPEPIETDDTDPPNYEPERSAAENAGQTSKEGSKSKSGTAMAVPDSPFFGVCASIPQTNESISVLFESAAAILYKASEIAPLEPPAEQESVRKTTTDSFTSSTPPAGSTTTSGAISEVPMVPARRRFEAVVSTRESPPQTLELDSPPCPICLEVPFHIRYCCPTVKKGPDAIRERLEELKRTNTDNRQLIEELEHLLRDSKVPSKPAVSTDKIQSREVSQPSDVSIPRTPNIPSNSYLSEVTVEGRNEGSSSESSDNASEGEAECKEPQASRGQQTSIEQPLLFNDDLEAVIRGPNSQPKSILGLLDRIVGDKGDKDSDSEDEKAELEEDPDEDIDRSMRRLSKRVTRSSDSESEEDSNSPSPSGSVGNAPNGLKFPADDSTKAVTESAERGDDGAVTRNSHDPPVLREPEGDSSEETHVGSDDRMVVDESTEDKGVATLEKQLSPSVPEVPVFQSLDPAIREAGDGPMSDLGGNLEVAEPDAIEPADELETSHTAYLSNPDPIEAPPEDIGSFFSGIIQSTPAPGVAKRLKTRRGEIPDDEAEQPVLLDQLSVEAPLSTKRKSRGRASEANSQETVTTRRSPRFSSVPPAASTPVALSLLNRRAKAKPVKTPAKGSEERLDVRPAATPSLIRWETLAEPLSSPQLDEPSTLLDELISSSPHPQTKVIPKRRGKKAPPRASQDGNSQQTQRLFDLTPSQVPFPYSQHKNPPTSTVLGNGKEKEVSTDSEEEPKATKKKAKLSAPYRTLSQLATQATLYSPSLPTPTNRNVTNGKAKSRAAAEESSSSSSSSEEEANESTHIPRGRRAGSVLETKKRKSILSKI